MKKIIFSFVFLNLTILLTLFCINFFEFKSYMPYSGIIGNSIWLKVMFGNYFTQTVFALVIFFMIKKLFNFSIFEENPILIFGLLSLVGLLWGTIRLNQTVCVEGDCKTGKAKYSYLNGNMYIGDVENFKANGNGILIFKDKTVYEGNMFEGMLHGKGELKTSEYILQAGWYQGKKNGEAVYKFKNGTVETKRYKNDFEVE